ncbi:hypothetical protein MMPV_006358 [Pyropia vietnamensis]
MPPTLCPRPGPARAVALRPGTAADMPAVARLIQELAEFEREPNAPALTVDDLVRDGFPPPGGGVPPAFRIILAVVARVGDSLGSDDGSGNDGDDSEGDGDTGGDGGGGGDGGRVPSRDGVIGMVLWYHTYSTWSGRALYVEDLIVTEEWRGRGIGHRLLRAAATAAVATRCARMDWVVYGWNTRAVEFYTRVGATVRGDLHLMRVEGRALHVLGCGAEAGGDGEG